MGQGSSCRNQIIIVSNFHHRDSEDEDEQDNQNQIHQPEYSDESENSFIQSLNQFEQFQRQQQEAQIREREEILWKHVKLFELLIQAQQEQIILNRFLEELQIEDNQDEDQLEINISLFYKQKHGQPINYPCKHAKCLTVATLNCHGKVNCQNDCPSFAIKDAVFDISRNQIFYKHDQNKFGNYVSIQKPIDMAQILDDSLSRSNMNESQKNEFCKNFSKVLCLEFMNSKK
ncbi:unnamed protein product (macronuclear) [Paramecium tetraurelia]|uniref:PIH1 N-terminal domain-containing protein n=1 Tax=Paramecium tetraurelia TaxID=5888 RepID=A0DMG9_PARTE|nr:uncharacterized protein GSPATT00018454001 [Paramecium tetraurelia]CAK84236.1 unnamed protein product [Paramecium tetraurelia]|eukprot:XP_001451633.1 hypothetical protein (macronuclear) [Paramecium tetraurelia strain d4-2]